MANSADDAQRATAKIIYDAMFFPDAGEDMPPFEEAERDQIGAYDRAMAAAAQVLKSRTSD